MEVSEFFPVWKQLTPVQQDLVQKSLVSRVAKKGELVHNGSLDCAGLMMVESGQLRSYILSDEGREITLYRLFDRDICVFSASCIIRSIQFEVMIEAEKETRIWFIPPMVYKKLMEESTAVANYTNEIMATRFTDVMWLMEQIMWKSMDKRVAAFLLEETAIEGTQEEAGRAQTAHDPKPVVRQACGLSGRLDHRRASDHDAEGLLAVPGGVAGHRADGLWHQR